MTELYTMDQMRDYAEAYHRSRVESSRADGGKGEADAFNRKLRVQLEQEWGDLQNLKRAYAAPQAECAPREAQPVGPRTTLNYDGTFDTTCAHCGGNGCFACLKSAAPTPERADADTAGAKPWWHALAKAADAVSKSADVWHGFSIQDAKVCVDAYLAASASERADAGKDAALTDEQIRDIWLRETGFDEQAAPFAILEFARAILAANKEPPDERAEPRALPDWRIADGWHNTFSTSNPYCPCDLKSFTKAVRWAEHAIEQAVKERK
jgi:hypothetical protein